MNENWRPFIEKNMISQTKSLGNLSELGDPYDGVPRSYSDDSIKTLVSELDRLTEKLSNSTDSFSSQFNSVVRSGEFSLLLNYMKNQLETSSQLRLLKFWDFLISSCGKIEDFYLLFHDDVANQVMLLPYEYSSPDVLQSYVTVLKGFSMKAKDIDSSILFTSNQTDLPLYSHAVPFIVSKDSVIVSAARMVVLNMCLVKDSNVIDFICGKNLRAPYDFLISEIDTEGFAFLADFLEVAPDILKEHIIKKLDSKMVECDISFLARATTFLATSPARSMISNVISKRIHSFPITNPVTLSLLSYSIDHKLILLDYAIKHGLTDPFTVPRFGKNIPPVPKTGTYIEEIYEILSQRSSIVHVCLSLHLLKLLFEEPPEVITTVAKDIIDELKTNPAEKLMNHLVSFIGCRQRIDIEYLLDPENWYADEPPEKIMICQLSEILNVLYRWKNMPLAEFVFKPIEEEETKSFSINEGMLTLTSNEIIINETQTYSLSRVVIEKRVKSRKHVQMKVFPDFQANRRKSLISLKVDDVRLDFQTSSTANSFETAVFELQDKLIRQMLDSIKL